MTKHTPGPWWVDDDSCVASGHGDDYKTVAEVFRNDGIDTATRKANADLIAAAPDLLEALKQLLNELHKGRKFNVRKDYSLLVADAAGRAAIAKAKSL